MSSVASVARVEGHARSRSVTLHDRLLGATGCHRDDVTPAVLTPPALVGRARSCPSLASCVQLVASDEVVVSTDEVAPEDDWATLDFSSPSSTFSAPTSSSSSDTEPALTPPHVHAQHTPMSERTDSNTPEAEVHARTQSRSITLLWHEDDGASGSVAEPTDAVEVHDPEVMVNLSPLSDLKPPSGCSSSRTDSLAVGSTATGPPTLVVTGTSTDSSMETWDGDGASAAHRASDGGGGGGGMIGVGGTPTWFSGASLTRFLKRKRQQALQAHLNDGRDLECMASPQSHLDMPPSPEADEDSSEAPAEPAPKKWYKKKRIMLPGILFSCLLLAFFICLGILYPRSPRVRANTVQLSDLSWMISPTGSYNANLTLSVAMTIANDNYYGSRFDTTPIFLTMSTSPDENADDMEPVGTLSLPGGYVGARSHTDVALQNRLENVHLNSSSEIIALTEHLRSTATSETTGRVHLLGFSVPWRVRTTCNVVCTLNLWTLTVTIVEEDCTTHTL